MKALVYTGPKQAEFMDVEDAKAQEGKVKSMSHTVEYADLILESILERIPEQRRRSY